MTSLDARRMRYAVAFVALAFLAGCGGRAEPARRGPITPGEWKAVLEDWYPNGKVDHPHPCAAIVLAITHLPVDGPTYSTAYRDLEAAAKRDCTHHPDPGDVRRGMSDADVGERAGDPEGVELHCWLYSSLTVCFKRGRVTTLRRR